MTVAVPIRSRLIGRAGGATPPRISRAYGVRLVEEDGREVLDAVSGSMTVNFGYTNPDLVEALTRAAERLPYLHESRGRLAELELLAEELVTLAPPGMAAAYFTVSGADAVEAAIRTAITYQRGVGRPDRTVIAGLTGSYHGATRGALAVSGVERLRRGYDSMLSGVRHLPIPFCPQCAAGVHPGDSCIADRLAALDAFFAGPDAEHIAAFVVEPVVANASGSVVLPRPYVDRLVELSRRHGFLIIADEITTSLGRAASMFVSPEIGLDVDIVCSGKGLGVGYAAISAVLLTAEVADALPADRNLLGHNYNGHPLAVAVARRVLERLRLPETQAQLETVGAALTAGLATLTATVPWAGRARTVGRLSSVDIVRDRDTYDPWPRSLRVAERVAEAAFAEGVLVLPGSGNVDGVRGDHITVAPPFITKDDEMDEMARRLGRAIERVCRDVKGASS